MEMGHSSPALKGGAFWPVRVKVSGRLVYQHVRHHEGRTRIPAVFLLVVCNWGDIGVKAHTLRGVHEAAISMNSGFSG